MQTLVFLKKTRKGKRKKKKLRKEANFISDKIYFPVNHLNSDYLNHLNSTIFMLCHMYLKGKIPCKQEISFHWELIIRLINTNNY